MFDYDPAKSAINKAKHGIDFVEAQALWRDDKRLVAPARSDGEVRWIVVGLIGGKHWCAVTTIRGETVRIISVRRAREGEVVAYERNEGSTR